MYSSWLLAISQRIEKTSKGIIFERNYSFFHHCLLSCRYVKPKCDAQADVRGGTAPPGPPVATALNMPSKNNKHATAR